LLLKITYNILIINMEKDGKKFSTDFNNTHNYMKDNYLRFIVDTFVILLKISHFIIFLE